MLQVMAENRIWGGTLSQVMSKCASGGLAGKVSVPKGPAVGLLRNLAPGGLAGKASIEGCLVDSLVDCWFCRLVLVTSHARRLDGSADSDAQ